MYKHEVLKPITHTFSEIFFYSKRCTYSCIKIFNRVPASILKFQKDKSNFKYELRKCLVTHAFCSVEEFLSHDQDVVWSV